MASSHRGDRLRANLGNLGGGCSTSRRTRRRLIFPHSDQGAWGTTLATDGPAFRSRNAPLQRVPFSSARIPATSAKLKNLRVQGHNKIAQCVSETVLARSDSMVAGVQPRR